MLFEDESMIRDYQAIQKTWFLSRNGIIPTTGKHRGVKLLATVDYETGHIVWQEKMNSTPLKRFFPFFKRSWRLIQQETGSGFWTMRIHHAKLLRPFLEAQKNRLELVYLPPYSPQLNIVEGLWKWLKSSVINNVIIRPFPKSVCVSGNLWMKS
ncbi:transposase [Paenibacillus larvae]|nr:transposase [Paenibacillus larvae]MDT2256018.1 transposase [Paenibacillus larvae]